MAIDKVRQLAEVFASVGKKLYLVGGSVRDELLHREGGDLDFTTDAVPSEIKALVVQLRPEAIYLIGEKFGTVGVVLDGHKLEITTFRTERYDPESRKPCVGFGTSLHDDLARRDFTINAIAQDPLTGAIIDLFGGLDDLRAGVIRAVGDGRQRFAEDPLRMLRAVRFGAQLGFTIEDATREAIRAEVERLRIISCERIAEEMNKTLLSPRPGQAVRALFDLGLMAYIVPEILTLRKLRDPYKRHKDVFEHTLAVVSRVPPKLYLRWAALLHDIAKPATITYTDDEVHFFGHEALGGDIARDILHRLRQDRQTIEKAVKLVKMHLRISGYDAAWTDAAVRRLARDAGDLLEDLFALSRADITSARRERVERALAGVAEVEERYKELAAREELAQIKSPLDGVELMELFGRGPGPWIKPVKEYLLSLVLEGELAQDDKERAAELAKEFVEKGGAA